MKQGRATLEPPWLGGCLCGGVRYRVSAPPEFQYLCHCRDCQRMSGSAYLPLLAVRGSAFGFEGEVRYFTRRADTGRVAREAFCVTCGSRIFGDGDGIPGLVVVTAGTLDEPANFQPEASIHSARKQHWDLPGLRCWPGEPELE